MPISGKSPEHYRQSNKRHTLKQRTETNEKTLYYIFDLFTFWN